MISPVARILDMHICPMQTPAIVPIPHVGGPVVGPGALTVQAGGLPVSVVGDLAVCVGPPDVMAVGSPTVFAEGKPVVRITDVTAHGGMVIVGCPTVLVGDSGSGSGGAASPSMQQAKAGGSSFNRTEDVASNSSANAAPQSGSAQSSSAASPTAAAAAAPAGNAWIEVEVLDRDGAPLPYRQVTITDCTGSEHTTFSDAHGLVRIDGIAPGQCTITLPELDQSSWKAV